LINTRYRAATAVRCTQYPDQLPRSAGRLVFDPILAKSLTAKPRANSTGQDATAAGWARAVTRSAADTTPLRQLVPKTSAGGGDNGVPRPAEVTCAPMTTVVQQGLPSTRHRGSGATCPAPALGIEADSTDHRKHLAATRRRTERKCSAERDRAAHKAEPGRYGPSAGRQ